MFKKILGLLFVAGMALSACKKEETPAPQPTNKELLSRTWKADSVLIDNVNVTSFFTGLRLTFRADNSYVSSSPTETDSGAWTFGSNETQIILDPGPDQEVWTIQTLTSSLLRISATADSSDLRAQFSPAP
jgi:hypothetical protein